MSHEEVLKKYAKVYTQEELNELMKIQTYFMEHQKEHQEHVKLFTIFQEKLRSHLNDSPSSSIGKELAKEWVNLFNLAWGPAYEAYPMAKKINKEKHDAWVAEGLHIYLWGENTYEWLLEAFKVHQIDLP